MASYEDLKNGRVRASIYIKGIRYSKTLPSRQKAKSWAKERELELSTLDNVADNRRTFADLFQRYSNEISSTKAGGHWEQVRLNMLTSKFSNLCSIRLVKAQREDIEDWIKLRLKQVKASSVNRELNLIGHTLTWARRWRWISHNPMSDLQRPKNPPARFRRVSQTEINQICLISGYREGLQLTLKREFVAAAFLFALETAMRAGEICSLTASNVNGQQRVAHLLKTKNGDQRKVPLSEKALAILNQLPKPENENTPLFQLTPRSLSTLFRKYRLKSNINDLTFHDSRHEAITRLADKLHVLELAATTGHRDIKELMTYYNKTAAELAIKLDVKTDEKAPLEDQLDYSHIAKQLMHEFAKLNSQTGQ